MKQWESIMIRDVNSYRLHRLEHGWNDNVTNASIPRRRQKMCDDVRGFVETCMAPAGTPFSAHAEPDDEHSENLYESICSTFDFQHHENTDRTIELKVLRLLLSRENMLMGLQHACGVCNAGGKKSKQKLRLFDMMTEVRDTSVNLLHLVSVWRTSSPDFDPENPRPFLYKGDNYLLKIIYDLNFIADTPYLMKSLQLPKEKLLQNPLMLKNTLFEPLSSPNPIERALEDTDGVSEGTWYDQRCRLRIAEQILLQEMQYTVQQAQKEEWSKTSKGNMIQAGGALENDDDVGIERSVSNPPSPSASTRPKSRNGNSKPASRDSKRASPTNLSDMSPDKQVLLTWHDQAQVQLHRIKSLRSEPLISASTDRLSPLQKTDSPDHGKSPKRYNECKKVVHPTKLTALDTAGSSRDVLHAIKIQNAEAKSGPMISSKPGSPSSPSAGESSSPTADRGRPPSRGNLSRGASRAKLSASDPNMSAADINDLDTEFAKRNSMQTEHQNNIDNENVFNTDFKSRSFEGVDYEDLLGASRIRKVKPDDNSTPPFLPKISATNIPTNRYGNPIKKKPMEESNKIMPKKIVKGKNPSETSVASKSKSTVKSHDGFSTVLDGGRSIADMITGDDVIYFLTNIDENPAQELQLAGAGVIIILSTHTEIPGDISWEAFRELMMVSDMPTLMQSVNPMRVPAFKVRSLLPFVKRLQRGLKHRVAAILRTNEVSPVGDGANFITSPEIRLLEWVIHVIEVANIRVQEMDEKNRIKAVNNKPVKLHKEHAPSLHAFTNSVVEQFQRGDLVNTAQGTRNSTPAQGRKQESREEPKIHYPERPKPERKEFKIDKKMAASVDKLQSLNVEPRLKDQPKPVMEITTVFTDVVTTVYVRPLFLSVLAGWLVPPPSKESSPTGKKSAASKKPRSPLPQQEPDKITVKVYDPVTSKESSVDVETYDYVLFAQDLENKYPDGPIGDIPFHPWTMDWWVGYIGQIITVHEKANGTLKVSISKKLIENMVYKEELPPPPGSAYLNDEGFVPVNEEDNYEDFYEDTEGDEVDLGRTTSWNGGNLKDGKNIKYTDDDMSAMDDWERLDDMLGDGDNGMNTGGHQPSAFFDGVPDKTMQVNAIHSRDIYTADGNDENAQVWQEDEMLFVNSPSTNSKNSFPSAQTVGGVAVENAKVEIVRSNSAPVIKLSSSSKARADGDESSAGIYEEDFDDTKPDGSVTETGSYGDDFDTGSATGPIAPVAAEKEKAPKSDREIRKTVMCSTAESFVMESIDTVIFKLTGGSISHEEIQASVAAAMSDLMIPRQRASSVDMDVHEIKEAKEEHDGLLEFAGHHRAASKASGVSRRTSSTQSSIASNIDAPSRATSVGVPVRNLSILSATVPEEVANCPDKLEKVVHEREEAVAKEKAEKLGVVEDEYMHMLNYFGKSESLSSLIEPATPKSPTAQTLEPVKESKPASRVPTPPQEVSVSEPPVEKYEESFEEPSTTEKEPSLYDDKFEEPSTDKPPTETTAMDAPGDSYASAYGRKATPPEEKPAEHGHSYETAFGGGAPVSHVAAHAPAPRGPMVRGDSYAHAFGKQKEIDNDSTYEDKFEDASVDKASVGGDSYASAYGRVEEKKASAFDPSPENPNKGEELYDEEFEAADISPAVAPAPTAASDPAVANALIKMNSFIQEKAEEVDIIDEAPCVDPPKIGEPSAKEPRAGSPPVKAPSARASMKKQASVSGEPYGDMTAYFGNKNAPLRNPSSPRGVV